MSGNSVAIAIHSAERNWVATWAHGCPIAAFVPGLVAGDAIVEACRRMKLRAPLMPVFICEAIGLIIFLFVARSLSADGTIRSRQTMDFAILAALLAFSMGVQNGAVRRIGGLKDVHTYVTGMLLATAHGLTTYGFWLARRLRRHTRSGLGMILRYSPRHRSLREAALAGSLWTMYVIGAVVGTLGRAGHGIKILWSAVGLLLFLAVIDRIRPIGGSSQQRR